LSGRKPNLKTGFFMKLQTTVWVATLTLLLTTASFAQHITQNIRGTIADQDSQMPLIGATVIVAGSNPMIGSSDR
jgi:hypothetical protein